MPEWGIFLTLISLVTRAAASIGQDAQRYPDSIGYETLSFSAPIDRPWPVPLFFAIAGSDGVRIALHVLLGVAAWTYLAWNISRFTRWRQLAFGMVMLIGLSPQIIRYDVAILSESLSITFIVSSIAATLHVMSKRTAISTVLWIASVTLCVSVRPTHILIPIVFLSASGWALIRHRKFRLTVTSVTLIAVFIGGIVSIRQSQPMSLLNLYTVVSSRVITDDDRFQWFVENGMPITEEMRSATGYDYAGDLPSDIAQVVQLPAGQQPPALMRAGGVTLAQWLLDNGWAKMARYLATHPSDTLRHAQQLVDSTLAPANGDFLPLNNGPMLPWNLFLPWKLWGVIIVVALTLLIFRQTSRQLVQLSLGIIATMLIIYLATVHTSGIEHVRHVVPIAITLRLVGVLLVCAVLPRRQMSTENDGADAAS